MKIKKAAVSLKQWGEKTKAFLTPSGATIRGAAWGIILVAALAHIFANIELARYIGIHNWVIFLLSLLLAALLGGLLFDLVAKWLANIPKLLKIAIVMAVSVVMFSFSLNPNTFLFMLGIILLLSSFSGAAVWLVYKGYWKEASSGHKVLTALAGFAGIAGLVFATWWFTDPGKKIEPPVNAAVENVGLPEHLDLPDPSKPGDYVVGYLTYGSGTDNRRPVFGEKATLITHTVDGSTFLSAWDGWRGKLRTSYFGFGKDSLPLNARVWYPESNASLPLVLIVHGNHLAQDYSDPGYAYLGELLASRGYIVASVDQNFLNGSFTNMLKRFSDENDARGWLLLKHLELWRQWDQDTSHVFFNRVDMERIALIGHSRGGEAVGLASLFNHLPRYPDDAKESFDFNFGIRSVIAIAPVDGQYQPAGILTPLADVNYFVLQGSHDADMQSYHGQRLMQRVSFSEHFSGFKAGLYIYGANHGQFNSVWGRKDFFSPRINFFNLKQLIPEKDQQTIAKVTISAFLEATMNDNAAYRKLFMDSRTGRHWLPENIYLNQFAASGMEYICRFEEDLDITTTSMEGGSIETGNLTVWREKLVPLKWGNLGSRAVYVGWNAEGNADAKTPYYQVNFPEGSIDDLLNKALVFYLADAKEDPGEGGETGTEGLRDAGTEGLRDAGTEGLRDAGTEGRRDESDSSPVDFTIELIDALGGLIRFGLSDCKYLQPAIVKKMGKLPFMKTAPDTEIVFDFFYFPIREKMKSGTAEHNDFIPERLAGIRFVFDRTNKGVLVINDLGFMTCDDQGQ